MHKYQNFNIILLMKEMDDAKESDNFDDKSYSVDGTSDTKDQFTK